MPFLITLYLALPYVLTSQNFRGAVDHTVNDFQSEAKVIPNVAYNKAFSKDNFISNFSPIRKKY